MVRLAAFPKCYMDELCATRTMTVFDWIRIAATLGVEGVELYPRFFQSLEKPYLEEVKAALRSNNLQMPMFCASPNFTHPDPVERKREIKRFRGMMEITAYLGGKSIRTLSGQNYPELTRKEGVKRVVECITSLLEDAQRLGVVMALENHYKDNYWQYTEFAQKLEVFLEILNQIDSEYLQVNFDASNPIIAGEDPITVLESVKHRLITMHASDRCFINGKLVHGVIGHGIVDYDRVFSILREVDFNGWISIEDGADPARGVDELKQSVEFLRRKIAEYRLGH